MSIVGSKKKNGVTYKQFGCGAHASKGSAICPNGLTISEAKANALSSMPCATCWPTAPASRSS
jgi:hypothetical protein